MPVRIDTLGARTIKEDTNVSVVFLTLQRTTPYSGVRDPLDPAADDPKTRRSDLIESLMRILHKAMCTNPLLGIYLTACWMVTMLLYSRMVQQDVVKLIQSQGQCRHQESYS